MLPLRMQGLLQATFMLIFMLSIFAPKMAAASKDLQPITDINMTVLLDGLLKGYDRRFRPNFGGPPVEVAVSIYVLSILEVSGKEMAFKFDAYFRQYWTDERLAYKTSLEETRASPESKRKLSSISIGPEFLSNIWVPDTFFVNGKKSNLQQSPMQNDEAFLKISSDGTIMRSVRLTIAAACPMDFRYFPRDSQLCSLEIESFKHTASDIDYKWKGGASVGFDSDNSLPQFRFIGYRQNVRTFVLSSGNYSRLAIEMQFNRSLGSYFLSAYLPSILIVIISWIGFWLHRQSAARAIIAVGTVLSIIMMPSAKSEALPVVSYLTALDVYVAAAFIFVLLALLELATVEYISYQGQRINASRPQGKDDLTARTNCSMEPRQTGGEPGRGIQPLDVEEPASKPKSLGLLDKLDTVPRIFTGFNPSHLDTCSRFLFPILFILFNFIYWIVYGPMDDIVADNLVLV